MNKTHKMTLLGLGTLDMCLWEACALNPGSEVLLCAHLHGDDPQNTFEHVSVHMRDASAEKTPSHGVPCLAPEKWGSPHNLLQFQPYNQPGCLNKTEDSPLPFPEPGSGERVRDCNDRTTANASSLTLEPSRPLMSWCAHLGGVPQGRGVS